MDTATIRTATSHAVPNNGMPNGVTADTAGDTSGGSKRSPMWRVALPPTVGNIGMGFDTLGMCLEGEGDVVELSVQWVTNPFREDLSAQTDESTNFTKTREGHSMRPVADLISTGPSETNHTTHSETGYTLNSAERVLKRERDSARFGDDVHDGGASLDTVTYDGDLWECGLLPRDPQQTRVIVAARSLLRACWPEHPPLRLTVRHTIGLPIGGGLGSSAAAAVGGAVLMRAWLESEGVGVSTADLQRAAGEAEGPHWDNIAPLLLGGVASVGLVPHGRTSLARLSAVPLHARVSTWGWILTTPTQRLTTAAARSVLPSSIGRAETVEQMQAVVAGVLGLVDGDIDRVAHAMCFDHIAAQARSSLMPHIATLSEWLSDRGACASCISGAGPTVLTLTASLAEAEDLAAELRVHDASLQVRTAVIRATPVSAVRYEEGRPVYRGQCAPPAAQGPWS